MSVVPAPEAVRVARRESLRERLRAADLDALLVTDRTNVRYLTGFAGSNAVLVVHAADRPGSEDRTVFGTDERYRARAAARVPELPHAIDRATVAALVGALAGAGVRRAGFESDHVTVDGLTALEDAATPAVGWSRAPGLVQQLRAVKDDGEVALLRAACAAADAAMTGLLADGGLAPRRTERDVALDLEDRMRRLGTDGPAFASIVAAGANAAVPHHEPTDTVLAAGDLVTLDFGALVGGYHSDMTRTVVLGRAADWQRELYALVGAAQAAGRAALRPGTALRDVDAAARDVVVDGGRGDRFVHGLGHGVGLEIHEAPVLSATAEGELGAGMVVTVEPGVYLPGRGGVRIEDTVVVRAGVPEVLTGFDAALLEV